MTKGIAMTRHDPTHRFGPATGQPIISGQWNLSALYPCLDCAVCKRYVTMHSRGQWVIGVLEYHPRLFVTYFPDHPQIGYEEDIWMPRALQSLQEQLHSWTKRTTIDLQAMRLMAFSSPIETR